MHRDAVEEIDAAHVPLELLAGRHASRGTTCVGPGAQHGFRNAQATVLAPTGTISFMMDCDTTGIEPDIALVKYKQAGRRRHAEDRQPDGAAWRLKRLGYDEGRDPRRSSSYIDEHDTIEGAPDLKAEHLPVFDCAFQPAQRQRGRSPARATSR